MREYKCDKCGRKFNPNEVTKKFVVYKTGTGNPDFDMCQQCCNALEQWLRVPDSSTFPEGF